MSKFERLTADNALHGTPLRLESPLAADPATAEPLTARPAPVKADPESAAPAPMKAGVTAEPPSKRSRKRLVLGLVALAVLGGAGYAGHDYWTVGRFMVSTDDAYVDADITLISSRVQGYVAEVPVKANDHVKAGQVLVRLDDGDYRIALQTAESRVETAGDTLKRIDAQIQAALAAVTQAEAGQDAAAASLKNATLTKDRVAGLAVRNVATQAQLDAANEGFDTASANLASAKAAVSSAEAQVAVLRAQRAEEEGARHELELAVAQAQRNLDLTVLRAPSDGTIANLSLDTGDLVAPGARLAALVPDAGLYIEANFKETQMAGIAAGAEVKMSFDALPGREFTGTVQSAAPATGATFSLLPADNATGNFTKVVQRVPVRIELPAEALATGQIRAGLSAVVDVDRRTSPTGTAVAEVN